MQIPSKNMAYGIFVKYKGLSKFKLYSDIEYPTEKEAKFVLQRMKATRDFRIITKFHGAEFKIDKISLTKMPMFDFKHNPLFRPMSRSRHKNMFRF